VETPKVAGTIVPAPLIFLCSLVLGVVISFFFPAPIWPGIWVRLIGVLILVLGIWLAALALRTLSRHKTSSEPWKPTTKLVQDGPYRFSRNPIYLSFALMYLGLSCLLNSLPALIMLVPVLVVVDRTQILKEERYLEAVFSEEYRQYRSRVRRWI
jgi:protein-S-isoprenylcysteine O-methyltransferase Ste14